MWRLTWTAALGEDRQGTCDCPFSTVARSSLLLYSSEFFKCFQLFEFDMANK